MSVIDKFKLDGKVAYVTGGARGIGKSLAKALGEAGASVIIADIDIAGAKSCVDELSSVGIIASAIEVDVTSEESVNSMVERIVADYGKLDIAVNNAGICINTAAEEMTLEQWMRVIDINLTGVFLTSQVAGRQMIKQGGGSIINIASMSAHIVNIPQPQCAYNASKAGVIQLSKSLAIEWCDYSVRVNTISPGYIGTDLALNSPTLKPLVKEWESMSPMHRIGKPEELQAIAVYLASDASPFTTGSDFIIDGAFSCV